MNEYLNYIIFTKIIKKFQVIVLKKIYLRIIKEWVKTKLNSDIL